MANKNFKGRPKGSNKVTITNPSLGKYFITQDEWSFNLVRKNDNSETIMGYYGELPHALTAAAKYLALDGEEISLDNYINQLNNKLNEFKQSFN
jgi:hypothetical protein